MNGIMLLQCDYGGSRLRLENGEGLLEGILMEIYYGIWRRLMREGILVVVFVLFEGG